jgi:hypothetical protein
MKDNPRAAFSAPGYIEAPISRREVLPSRELTH